MVKYLSSYADAGINIEYIIPQNEPLHSANGYPTMILNSNQETESVKLLKMYIDQTKLETKIVIYDHNWDNIEYSRSILRDSVSILCIRICIEIPKQARKLVKMSKVLVSIAIVVIGNLRGLLHLNFQIRK